MDGEIILKIYITMEQNNIWMRYLIIGTIISSILLFLSCTKDYEYSVEFLIINDTNYDISFDERLVGYNVKSKQQYRAIELVTGDRKVNIENFSSPLHQAGPLNIKFQNNKLKGNYVE